MMKPKYFVLKPRGDTPYAIASRIAMEEYARYIRIADEQLADDIEEWVAEEMRYI